MRIWVTIQTDQQVFVGISLNTIALVLEGERSFSIECFLSSDVFKLFPPLGSALFELCLQIGRYWYFPSQLLKTGGSFPRNYP